MIRHKQLTPKEREELAIYAIEHGINPTAKLYGKHYATVKLWRDRFFNNDVLTNVESTPLTAADFEYLNSFIHLIDHKPLRELKREYSLPFSIGTIATYYQQQNIPISDKYLLNLKCPNCKLQLRAINVFFGRPRDIQCPHCGFYKLERYEYLKIPFYNPRQDDYFFDSSLLAPISSDIFKDTVLPLLKIPKDLRCLMVYIFKPRKFNRIHMIKHFDKDGDNTVPITYCGVDFPNTKKREILNTRSQDIDTNLICHNCQIPYLRDFNKYGEKFPKIIAKSSGLHQTAFELFYLAQKYNIKIARTLMDISERRYYILKKRFPVYFEAIRYLKTKHFNYNQ